MTTAVDSIIGQYLEGKTIAEVAKTHDCYPAEIREHLVQQGVMIRTMAETKALRKQQVKSVMTISGSVADIVALYNSGASIAKVAGAHNMTAAATRELLVANDVTIRPKGRQPASGIAPKESKSGQRPVEVKPKGTPTVGERGAGPDPIEPKEPPSKAPGSRTRVQRGRTDPELAANLPDVLINKAFAYAICPFDPEHTMELKTVSHSANYGPRQLQGYKDNIPIYKQKTGELALHQCLECNVVISYTTQHPRQFRRQNEPKESGISGVSFNALVQGVRPTDDPTWSEMAQSEDDV